MKLYNRILSFIVLFIGVVSSSRSQMTQQQTTWLTQYASEKGQLYQSQRAEAESLALQLGLPIIIRGQTQIAELQRIEDGELVYYVTENANAAKTIATDKVLSGTGISSALTGEGITLGIWDVGGVRRTHQEFDNSRVTQRDGNPRVEDHPTHVAGTMVAKGVDVEFTGYDLSVGFARTFLSNDN